MQKSLPLLKKSKNGSIINMSSTASHLGYPPFFAYSAAKGSSVMTKSMAIHCHMTNLLKDVYLFMLQVLKLHGSTSSRAR